MQPSESLRAYVERIAREAGAKAVRVTTAQPDASTRTRLAASFERGDLETWSYDERYARSAADPQSLLPGARSVICVAVRYDTPPPERPPLRGRVSNYAWSHDYHAFMRELLQRIAAALDAVGGEGSSVVACDTKPLAERAFAHRSGLGWVGKHTNLISPQLGSFVFLGEVVTRLAIEADEPVKKTCGACTRCVDVCPTGALRGDYTIDATRCIADLTQRTDFIPREMRALMGEWVWGCDLCQEACPPTVLARKREAPDPRFAAKAEFAVPDLVELLNLRSGTFKRVFARSAMGWRGAAVLRRNAAVALGNALDRSAVRALVERLSDDPHPMVRGHVAWALGRIGSPSAIAALRHAQAQETDVLVLDEIAAALEPFAAPAPLQRT